MDNGGGNGAGCFEVEIWADTAKFTNVIVAGFRKCRDLVGEGNVLIKDKAKVASRVGSSERRVVYLLCRLSAYSNTVNYSKSRHKHLGLKHNYHLLQTYESYAYT